MAQLGCITEQGNMGLGFSVIPEDDVQKMKADLAEQYSKEEKNNDSDAASK